MDDETPEMERISQQMRAAMPEPINDYDDEYEEDNWGGEEDDYE